MFSPAPSEPTAPLADSDLAPSLKPFGESTMLPPAAYTSAEVFAWEQAHFFWGWQFVGMSGDVPQGASVATRSGRTSIVLTRASDGVLRAFANTCRHRGHELLPCGGRSDHRALVCPYHGWSYRLDGALIAAPGYDELPGFSPPAYGLTSLRAQEWHGYLLVDPSGTAPDLAAHLGELEARVAGHTPERLVVAARHEYVVRANWKTITENYHECYHCPQIHPELCRVTPADSGENWDAPGAWIGGWMDLREGAATMSLDGHSDGVVIPGLPQWSSTRVDYLGVFPNLLVSLHPDYVMTHRMVPLTPSSTWVECSWAFPPEALARNGFDPGYAVDFWDITNKQDWAACESVQRGMESGMARPGPLSPVEDAVYQFVSMVARGYTGGQVHLKPQFA